MSLVFRIRTGGIVINPVPNGTYWLEIPSSDTVVLWKHPKKGARRVKVEFNELYVPKRFAVKLMDANEFSIEDRGDALIIKLGFKSKREKMREKMLGAIPDLVEQIKEAVEKCAEFTGDELLVRMADFLKNPTIPVYFVWFDDFMPEVGSGLSFPYLMMMTVYDGKRCIISAFEDMKYFGYDVIRRVLAHELLHVFQYGTTGKTSESDAKHIESVLSLCAPDIVASDELFALIGQECLQRVSEGLLNVKHFEDMDELAYFVYRNYMLYPHIRIL